MMLALLLYCWSRGVRSSRAIERACVEDVACRVIAAHQRPDHATIARFVVRHERALGELFGEVLALCADAGLATVGVIAIDGTKVHANASRDRTMDYEQIARAIVEEAIATDAAETAVHGERRGDELPEIVATARRPRGLAARRAPAARPAARGAGRADSARATARGCWRPSAAWRKTSPSSARRTPTSRPTDRRGVMKRRAPHERAPEALHAAGDTAGQDQPHRPRLASSCTACAAGCRATTPKPSATSST